MALLTRAATDQDILVSIHPRRFGIIGDGLAGNPSALILDGIVQASGRAPTINFVQVATGLSGAGAVTLTGVTKGDKVSRVIDTSSFTDVSSSFESTITVTGQIQESASVSGHTVMVFVSVQS